VGLADKKNTDVFALDFVTYLGKTKYTTQIVWYTYYLNTRRNNIVWAVG
jgi:hypothetical protein